MNTYSKNSKYKIFLFFFSFLYIKGLDINTDLISAKGYTNAGVDCLKIEETGELWVSINNVGNGLGVKNILVIIKT